MVLNGMTAQFTEDVAFSCENNVKCPLTNNSQIRGNYSTIIKNIVIDKENLSLL